ncbi:hypothetical protein Tco_0453600 [Tanacetum coccineum]
MSTTLSIENGTLFVGEKCANNSFKMIFLNSQRVNGKGLRMKHMEIRARKKEEKRKSYKDPCKEQGKTTTRSDSDNDTESVHEDCYIEAKGNFRAFHYLLKVLHILTINLFHLYEFVNEAYLKSTMEELSFDSLGRFEDNDGILKKKKMIKVTSGIINKIRRLSHGDYMKLVSLHIRAEDGTVIHML